MERKQKVKFEAFNIKTRLQDLREEYDLGQKEVASYLGIDQRQYSNYELSKRSLSLYQLIQLAKFYNTSTDYILYMTDVREPYEKSIVDWET